MVNDVAKKNKDELEKNKNRTIRRLCELYALTPHVASRVHDYLHTRIYNNAAVEKLGEKNYHNIQIYSAKMHQANMIVAWNTNSESIQTVLPEGCFEKV